MNLPFITFICDSSFCFLGTDCDLKRRLFSKKNNFNDFNQDIDVTNIQNGRKRYLVILSELLSLLISFIGLSSFSMNCIFGVFVS